MRDVVAAGADVEVVGDAVAVSGLGRQLAATSIVASTADPDLECERMSHPSTGSTRRRSPARAGLQGDAGTFSHASYLPAGSGPANTWMATSGSAPFSKLTSAPGGM